MYTKQIARLTYLASMIAKYAEAYRKGPSSRRQDAWAYEYDDCREEQPLAWEAYCTKRDFYIGHTSHDCRA